MNENEKVQIGYVMKVGPGYPIPSVNDVDEPTGVAVSPDGQRIYVAESGGERLIKMFDRDGNPFPGRRSRPLEDRLGSDYQYVVETTHLKDGDPFQLFSEGRLSRRTEKIIRESDGKLMGQWVIYGRIGGEAILFGHPTSTICPEYRSADETLIRSVFLRRGE